MKILILAAMDKEISLLEQLLEDKIATDVDGIPVNEGTISGHDITLAKCGIGKVNAALNAYRLISHIRPDLVINSGVAGGAGGMRIGDLLIAGKVGYHDVWCGPGTHRGQADGQALIFTPYAPVLDIAHRELPAKGVSYGMIATGDIFVSSADEIAAIHAVYPDAVAVDMESAAIAHACSLTATPFNIIRVASDTPGEGENLSQYRNFWTEAPSKTFNAIRTILASL